MGRPSSNYTARELKKARNFCAIAYDDVNESGEPITEIRLQYYWENFWIIRHDQDIWSEDESYEWLAEHPGQEFPYEIGSIKKPHYHIIGSSGSPIMLGLAAKKFGLPSNQVQICKNLKTAKRYLVHKDNRDKFQYSSDSVVTNDPSYSDCLKDDMDITAKASIILEYIESYPEYLTFSELSKFCIGASCWDEFRRGQHLFTKLVEEHNHKWTFEQSLMKMMLEQSGPDFFEHYKNRPFSDFVQEVLSLDNNDSGF